MRDASEADVCPRCQKCERWRAAPDYIRDPMLLWERFPCPPPGTDHARLLIELDWTGELGNEDGCEAFKKVAKRCHVDIKQFNSMTSLPECDVLYEAVVFCGLNCIIAVILACICVLFCLVLVLVCVRYVKRSDKKSSSLCSKVLSPEPKHNSIQVNKNYAQTQCLYTDNTIGDRRGLPCEVRVTDNGVESRLLRAIQQNQLSQYNTDDLCSQCMSDSRQGTLQYNKNHHGYEVIYWDDDDYFLKRVPSTQTFTRTSLNRDLRDRDRSSCCSSANVSNIYDYISDHLNDSSYNSMGRKSNHSTFKKRKSVQNDRDPEYSDNSNKTRNIEDESMILDSDITDDNPYKRGCRVTRPSLGSIHAYSHNRSHVSPCWTDRSPYQQCSSETNSWTDRSPYQQCSSESSCTYNQGNTYCDRSIHKGYYSDTPQEYRHHLLKTHSNRIPINRVDTNNREVPNHSTDVGDSGVIKGYKFTTNPSYYDDSYIKGILDDLANTNNLQREMFDIDDKSLESTFR